MDGKHHLGLVGHYKDSSSECNGQPLQDLEQRKAEPDLCLKTITLSAVLRMAVVNGVEARGQL